MTDRQWTGVVLAGGKSTRMGQDKALMELDGERMLDRAVRSLRTHAREILVIGDPAKYASEHATTVPDDAPGKGPLGGIVTALKHARYVRLIVLACDLPLISDRLIHVLKREMEKDFDAVVPRHSGHIEPLVATYHRRAIETFDRCLLKEELRMSTALGLVRTAYMDVEPGTNGWPKDLFKNMNSPADL
ncbi:MAG: molybdenum cofactor guanylyltransferase [Flavobacteriales bacterium]|nr:molybdenum cofactor guanylyltransferase [Flavobacteriales bacterium]